MAPSFLYLIYVLEIYTGSSNLEELTQLLEVPMRIILIALMAVSLTACYGHRGGSAHVDGVGGVNWGDGNYKSKGCPPGLAKQGRCY